MSVSGLTLPQRHVCRELATQAAMLGLHNASELHYTQGTQRWEGIAKNRLAVKGEFPHHADCSAFGTWCLAQGLKYRFKLPDIVNGEHWLGGFTGTLARNGRQVMHLRNVLRGDLVLYGPAPDYEHVAIVVGHKMVSGNRTPLVVSNGSEPGPFLLGYNYRSDVGQIRRYI